MADDLEKKLEAMEHEIERMHAYNEIQNLVAKYMFIHTPATEHLSYKLFALNQPDVSVEIAMWGKNVGAENIRRTWRERKDPTPGEMFEHQLTTPVIQVAKDGKTAKGQWFSPGHETQSDRETGKLVPNWVFGKFAADFIKEDGEWKIWHYHWLDTFFCPYYTSWVDFPQPPLGEMMSMPGLEPTEPTTTRGTYFPDRVREPVPDWPEPYETWDGKSAC